MAQGHAVRATSNGYPSLQTIVVGASPYRTCYIEIQNSGGSGWTGWEFQWDYGTASLYVPVMYLADTSGNWNYENANNVNTPGGSPPSIQAAWVLSVGYLYADPTYYGAIPNVYNPLGEWWEFDEDVRV